MREALLQKFRERYGRAPEVLARAPGRIEFIGNHTDYNGGPVLGAALDRGIGVALGRRDDGQRRFASDGHGLVTVPPGPPVRQVGAAGWANYPLGVLAALPHFGLRVPEGFDYLAASDLPAGAGLSSSAAIELSSALAFTALAGETPSRETLVKAARQAENHFVGVPCGILDQGVSGFGRRDHLVFIDCRGPVFDTVPLPGGVHFWLFNTHTKHALIDGLYAERHRECLAAAAALGAGQLVEVSPEALAAGEERLAPVLRKRARHIVEEIARVGACVASLRGGDLTAVGRLLTASHRSSRDLFENSAPELDFLVDQLAVAPGVYGARLTGGGFGGAVMALTAAGFGDEDAGRVAAAYARAFGRPPQILHARTGDGAALLVP